MNEKAKCKNCTNEKEMIEQMAKEIVRVLFEIRQDMTSVVRYIRHDCNKDLHPNLSMGELVDRHLKYKKLATETANNILKNLYKNNKLKEIESLLVDIARNGVPEGSVVLSKEEYKNDFCSQFDKGYKTARKETAKEIIEEIKSLLFPEEGGLLALLVAIADKYGVEVEE